MAPIRFRDPLGRRFEFSFALCRTWAGMEDLLLDCFPHVATSADDNDGGGGDGNDGTDGSVNARVRRGHYDLLGPDGHIVLPMVWESVVRPGWRVNMVFWPDVFARADGPRAAVPVAATYPWWRKALVVLRAPFGRPGHFRPPPRAGPAVERRRTREPPRETWVLPQPWLGGEEDNFLR